jgi:O-antigen/teichoic acid export membrane protein
LTASSPREVGLATRAVLAGASNIAGRFISILVWFLLTPFILDSIGPDAYGLWVLATSLLSYGYLLDLGMSVTLTRDVSEHVSRGEFDVARETVATTVRLQALMGCVAFLAGLVLALLITPVFQVDVELRDELPIVIALMGATVGLSLAAGPLTAVLRGVQRYDLVNVLIIANVLMTAGGIIAVLGAGGGLVAMIAVTIPVTVVTAVVGIALVRRAAPSIVGWRGGSRSHGRRILGFSAPIFTVQVAGLLQSRSDEFIIGALLSVGSVTPYALGRRLSEIPQIVGDQALKSLLPISAELAADRDLSLVKRAFVSGTRIALALVAPLGLVIATLAGPILAVWVGPEYSNPGAVVAILTVAVVLDSALWPSAYVLQGIGRHRPLALIALASAIVNVGCSVILTARFGLTGAATGTLIGHGLAVTLTIPWVVRVLGVTPGDLVRRIALPALGPLLPSLTVILVARTLVPDPGVIGIGLIASAGLAAYALTYLTFGASELERRLAGDILAKAALRRPR